MAGAIIIVVVVWCCIWGAVGAAIGGRKGLGGVGFWLGFFLGFIGLIIVAVMQPTPQAEAQHLAQVQTALAGERGQDQPQSINQRAVRDCPWCAETIKAAAIVCRFCGREVEALPAAGSATASRTGSAGVEGSSSAPGNAFGLEQNIGLSLDVERSGRGNMVIVGSATIALLVALFLPWFSASFSYGAYAADGKPYRVSLSASESALQAHGWMYLVFVLGLGVLGYLVVRAMSDGGRLPLSHWRALVGVIGLDVLLTLICFFTKPSFATWSYGAYIGLVAALGAVTGAVIRRSEPEMLLAGRATATTPVAAVAGLPRAPSPPVAPTPAVDLQMAPPASPAPDARPATSTPVPLAAPEPVPAAAGPAADVGMPEATASSKCPSCGRANPIRNKFCNGCGGPLVTAT